MEKHSDLPLAEEDSNTSVFSKMYKHNAVITNLLSDILGTNSATAVAATSLLQEFQFGIMVGIGGGVPRNPYSDSWRILVLGIRL